MAGYAYHLNVMPLDAAMPDPGQLVRATDITAPGVVFDDGDVRVSAARVMHGHAAPAFAYRFETADGSVVFSGDTTVSERLIELAQGADILVHQVADLGYLKRHGWSGAALDRMAGLHTDVTEVGGVAQRAGYASSSSPTTCPPNRTRSARPTGPSGPARGSAAAPWPPYGLRRTLPDVAGR